MALPGERHGLFGTTGSGKSCHLDWEMRWRSEHYPDVMQALVDSKPRFRAETERMPFNPRGRRNAAWRYTHWSKGPVLPNSVLVPLWDSHPFRGLWKRPGEIAVFQSGEIADWRRILILLKAFTQAHIGDRERHISIDEILDFYGRTTHSISNKDDVFYSIARAGRERGIGETLAAQRIKGIPILIRTMLSRLTLYHLDNDGDMAFIRGNGIEDALSPQDPFVFRHWEKQAGGSFAMPVTGKLKYPDEYLGELVAA